MDRAQFWLASRKREQAMARFLAVWRGRFTPEKEQAKEPLQLPVVEALPDVAAKVRKIVALA